MESKHGSGMNLILSHSCGGVVSGRSHFQNTRQPSRNKENPGGRETAACSTKGVPIRGRCATPTGTMLRRPLIYLTRRAGFPPHFQMTKIGRDFAKKREIATPQKDAAPLKTWGRRRNDNKIAACSPRECYAKAASACATPHTCPGERCQGRTRLP